MIMYYTVPEIWQVTNVIIFYFGLIFALLPPPPPPTPPPNSPENQNLKKNEKNIILQMCTINDNHMMDGS